MDDWSRFATNIFRINSLLVEAGEGITQPAGQSSARWQVLGRLWTVGRTVADLARDIGHARQSVQRVADALERDGLVASRAKPGDKRTALLELTDEGRRVLNEIYAGQVAWSARVTSRLSPEQLTEAIAALETIAAIVEDVIKTDGD
jgi:DNA-binding MarR family transcriptional regulator